MSNDDKRAWVQRVLGHHVSAGAAGGQDIAAALNAWRAARSTVVTQLSELSAAVAAAQDPESAQAIILLRAIMANLTPTPTTLQDIEAVERYLTTDAIIMDAERPNGFGPPIAIREPLLPALATLRRAMPPQESAGARHPTI